LSLEARLGDDASPVQAVDGIVYVREPVADRAGLCTLSSSALKHVRFQFVNFYFEIFILERPRVSKRFTLIHIMPMYWIRVKTVMLEKICGLT